MKNRALKHIAMALMAWYMMSPPFDTNNQIRSDVPLSLWTRSVTYETAVECQKGISEAKAVTPEQAAAWDEEQRRRGNRKTPLSYELTRALVFASVCVASNDPRLAPLTTCEVAIVNHVSGYCQNSKGETHYVESLPDGNFRVDGAAVN